ncbi:MAG: hypothetical protein HOE90_03700 [Bacteriovoracaceae bacterium]|jgi:hypothetical protein|nr:hypothetical protein [Bacteriovoracaceae bacterium]
MVNQCPWSGLEPGSISFCEKKLCALIVEPANSWSNIGFIIIGLLLFYKCYKNGQLDLLPIPIGSFSLGIGSFAFYATGTFWGEYFDNLSMFLISSFIIGYALRRIVNFSNLWLYLFISFITLFSGIILYLNHSWGIAIFIGQIVIGELLELSLFLKKNPSDSYKIVPLTICILSSAILVWILDLTGKVCNPDNHIFNGHAYWHLALSVGLYLFYIFQQQFSSYQKKTEK